MIVVLTHFPTNLVYSFPPDFHGLKCVPIKLQIYFILSFMTFGWRHQTPIFFLVFEVYFYIHYLSGFFLLILVISPCVAKPQYCGNYSQLIIILLLYLSLRSLIQHNIFQ